MIDGSSGNLGRLGAMTDPTDTTAARHNAALVDLLWLVMRRIWEDAEQRLAPSGLTMKHSWALHALDEPMSMRGLAERLGIDASYVTAIADQLEEKGLIERRPHPSDRRIKSLALTDDGRRVRDHVLVELWTSVPVLDGLTAAERLELRRLLEKTAGDPTTGDAGGARSNGD
jgi:MarR family transcriptional regulator, organic hydroperoxide resistance regulator